MVTDTILDELATSLVNPLSRIATMEHAIERMRGPECLHPSCRRKATHTITLVLDRRKIMVTTCDRHAHDLCYQYGLRSLMWDGWPVRNIEVERSKP